MMKYRKWFVCIWAVLLAAALAVPVFASDPVYVFDEADILTPEDEELLQFGAKTVASSRDCGVYMVTLWDYHEYGSDVLDAAENYFRDHDLGVGSGADGIVLLLSMAERDYALLPMGSFGKQAFTDYGLDVLSERFLDNFGSDHWYLGFNNYLFGCDDLLEAALNGEPVGAEQEKRSEFGQALLMILVIPAAIAGIACGIMAFSMKTARQKTHADDYRQGIQLIGQQDRFITRTVRREKIESSSSSSSSRGSSGKSGKF